MTGLLKTGLPEGEPLNTAPRKKAKKRGLNRLSMLRSILVGMRRVYLVPALGLDIHATVQVSVSAKLDLTFPEGVHIEARSYLAFETRILTHDRSRGLYLHTRVGENCLIGGRAMILPGVEIGDNCIIGAGSVVTKSVPPKTLVAGNPARVLREDIDILAYGRFRDADAMEASLVEAGLA